MQVQVMRGATPSNVDFPASVSKRKGSLRVVPGVIEVSEEELKHIQSSRPDVARFLRPMPAPKAKSAPAAAPETKAETAPAPAPASEPSVEEAPAKPKRR